MTDSSRWISWTLVIVIHGVFVLVLQQLRMAGRLQQNSASPAMTWIRLTPRQLPRESGRPPPRREVSLSSRVSPLLSTPVTAPNLPAMVPDTAPARVDWSLQGALSARAAAGAASGDRYRSLGPRKGEPDESSDPVLFETPERRAGTVDRDVHGDPIVWINEHCYQELEKPVPTARDVTRSKQEIHIPKCVFPLGRPKPRGDLFDHIRKEREKNLPPVYPPASEARK